MSRARPPLQRSEALVLRVVEFGESDRIVSLLTPDRGRVSAIAKGARRSVKRFPGTLDLFNELKVELRPRPRGGMPLLERAVLVSAFLSLREHAGRFGLAGYLVELLGRLAPEGGPRRELAELFAFARGALQLIERARPDPRLRVLLELRTLDAVGLRPELGACVRCGRTALGARVGFHVGDGGVVCDACAASHEVLLPVGLGTLRALAQSLRFPLAEIGRVGLNARSLAEAELIVGRFQRYHVGLELRSEPFLAQVLA